MIRIRDQAEQAILDNLRGILMLPYEGPGTLADSLDSDSLFTGLIRKSSGGKETVDYLAAVSAFGRYVAAGPATAVLLHDACELAALTIQADLLLVAQLTADARQLSLQIASFNASRKIIVQSLEGISAEPEISMAAFAMHSANVVQSEDIIAERRFTDLLLRRLQMGSGIFAALCSHNRAFGAMGLVRRRRGCFTTDEFHFTTGIAQLLASYLAQNTTQEQLRRREASIEAILDSVESLILSLDKQGIVREMNAASIRASGFRNRELRDRPFWNTLIVPRDSERVAAVFRHGCRPGTIAVFDADLLSKEGQHRAVQWSLNAVEAGEDSSNGYVLSGVDRTELRECSRQLEKYRKTALGSTESAGQSREETGRTQPPGKPGGADKRSSQRREYSYFQHIAPILNDRLPSDEQFTKVACCDISAGGLSYLLESPPAYEELVISLGTPPNDGKVIAKVVRVVKKEVDGHAMYQVGCQFTGRVAD